MALYISYIQIKQVFLNSRCVNNLLGNAIHLHSEQVLQFEDGHPIFSHATLELGIVYLFGKHLSEWFGMLIELEFEDT